MNTASLNLEKLAAERAQAMVSAAQGEKKVETLERLATKALGVLQEQGVYALILFLFSRTGDEATAAQWIRTELFAAWQALPGSPREVEDLSPQIRPERALEIFSQHLLGNLRALLLLRDLYEQTLIYARYAAKAAKGG